MSVDIDLPIAATRYDLARLQIARTLLPIATVVCILARRLMGDAMVIAAFALLAILLALWFSASKRFVRARLRIRDRAIRFAPEGEGGAARDDDRSNEMTMPS